MTSPVFTTEVYHHSQYLNPSHSKIKHSFLKKSVQANPKTIHTRSISLQHGPPKSKAQNAQQGYFLHLKDVIVDNTNTLKEIKQILTIQKSAINKLQLQKQQLKVINQKNASLENDLKLKDTKLQTLRQKYEDLLIRLQQFSHNTKSNSFNTSFDSITNRSLSISRKSDYLRQLKKIKERLKQVNFSKLFIMINKVRIPYQK